MKDSTYFDHTDEPDDLTGWHEDPAPEDHRALAPFRERLAALRTLTETSPDSQRAHAYESVWRTLGEDLGLIAHDLDRGHIYESHLPAIFDRWQSMGRAGLLHDRRAVAEAFPGAPAGHAPGGHSAEAGTVWIWPGHYGDAYHQVTLDAESRAVEWTVLVAEPGDLEAGFNVSAEHRLDLPEKFEHLGADASQQQVQDLVDYLRILGADKYAEHLELQKHYALFNHYGDPLVSATADDARRLDARTLPATTDERGETLIGRPTEDSSASAINADTSPDQSEPAPAVPRPAVDNQPLSETDVPATHPDSQGTSSEHGDAVTEHDDAEINERTGTARDAQDTSVKATPTAPSTVAGSPTTDTIEAGDDSEHTTGRVADPPKRATSDEAQQSVSADRDAAATRSEAEVDAPPEDVDAHVKAAACKVALSCAERSVDQVHERVENDRRAEERDSELARWYADDTAARAEDEQAIEDCAADLSGPSYEV